MRCVACAHVVEMWMLVFVHRTHLVARVQLQSTTRPELRYVERGGLQTVVSLIHKHYSPSMLTSRFPCDSCPLCLQGVSRLDNVEQCHAKCPGIRLVHVETISKDGVSQVPSARRPNQHKSKVSLQRYRNARYSWLRRPGAVVTLA